MIKQSLRRALVVLSLVAVVGVLPVARPGVSPDVRHWAVALDGSQAIRAPGAFSLVGVSWPASSKAPEDVRVRTSTDGRRWSSWHRLEVEPEVGPDAGTEGGAVRTTMPVWTGSRRFAQVEFGGPTPDGAQVRFVDPGPDPTSPASAALASPSKPGIITREAWGADESIRKGTPEYAAPLRLAIVHHTATTDSYPKSESDNIVRAIYAYHVKTNGWDDIGYNFLVDRYGQIFEGRSGGVDKPVIGAHALGFNRHSTGISIIGNFATTKPPEVAMNSLKRILSWKLDQGFIDPLSSLTYISNGSNKYKEGTKVTLKAITSHRNVGKTECPGDPLYASLPWLRTEAAKDGLPKLYDAKTSRKFITPNGDGIADALKLTGRFTGKLSWKVEVVDSAGTVFHSVSGFGTTLAVNWYGKDPRGVVVPQDEYRFRITGSNASGSIRTAHVPLKVLRFANGTFFRATPSLRTYILEKNVLRPPSAYQARTTRYRATEFVSIPDEATSAYRIGPSIGFREGTVVEVGNSVYVISKGARRPTTKAVLSSLGYNLASVVQGTTASLAPHPDGTPLRAADGYPAGAALKASTSREAWLISETARPFFSKNVRDSYTIRDIDLAGPADSHMAGGATSDPLGFRDGTLVRVAETTTIYFISDGLRRSFRSSKVFARMGFRASNIRTATPAELALHAEGKPL